MRSLAALILLVTTTAAAAPKVTAKRTALYPSKSCKTKIPGENGSDPVLTCPAAVKGYEVEVSFSAIDTHVTVSGGGQQTSFSGLVGKSLEWRFVDGKPIALLVEIADHDEENLGKSLNPRVVVLAWGQSTPQSEIPIVKKATAAAWKKARAAADALAK